MYVMPAALVIFPISGALLFLTMKASGARHGLAVYHICLVAVALAAPADQGLCWVLGGMSYGAIHQ